MNKNVITRLVGGVLAGFLLVGASAGIAAADDGPAVQSKVNTGISVGGLLDIGSSSNVNGTDANTGVKVGGPAGISTSLNNDTNVGIDILTDLAASVTAAIG
ncbi:hypothetical protein ACFWZ2_22205 [Streptomyces sp. NPDC059002]|uniref:hypothetical protein n=1 Tax=Streptomyces sp. NPDC059002 TaxID=3346690 RepID=UPI0036A06435